MDFRIDNEDVSLFISADTVFAVPVENDGETSEET